MLTYSRYGFAGRVRISVKSLNARADGNVIGHATLGVQAARSGTRIDAFVLFAALISRTIHIIFNSQCYKAQCPKVQSLKAF